MANEHNLIPNRERTPSELREMARNGGLASGEARRKRKTLKEELLLMLSDGDIQEKISLSISPSLVWLLNCNSYILFAIGANVHIQIHYSTPFIASISLSSFALSSCSFSSVR